MAICSETDSDKTRVILGGIISMCIFFSANDTNDALKEVQALIALDHPGIVRFYDAWKEEPPAGWQV